MAAGSSIIILACLICLINIDFNHSAEAADRPNPPCHFEVEGACYYEWSERLSWFDAVSTCKMMYGGYLAEIDSQVKLDYLKPYMTGSVWTGGIRKPGTKKGFFFYGTGNAVPEAPVDRTDEEYWGSRQPNNKFMKQNCLMMMKNDGYRMHDRECVAKAMYLCEVPQ